MYKGGLSLFRKAEDPARRSPQRQQGLLDTQPTCLPVLQHKELQATVTVTQKQWCSPGTGSSPNLSSGCCASGKLLLFYSKTSAYNLLTASRDVTSAMPFFCCSVPYKGWDNQAPEPIIFSITSRESQHQLPTTRWNDLLKLSPALTPTDCAHSCV